MEVARDLAKEMEARGEGIVLDQFANAANPLAHTRTTGPELWAQTGGRITHFVTSMGTTGTAMGTSRYLKEQNQDIQIVGLQPAEGASIAGIRRWPAEYMPSIFDASRVDKTLDISQDEAEETMRALARCEGIFAGVSSGGCVAGALRVAATVENATIVCIICDRGVRFHSAGLRRSHNHCAAAGRSPWQCVAIRVSRSLFSFAGSISLHRLLCAQASGMGYGGNVPTCHGAPPGARRAARAVHVGAGRANGRAVVPRLPARGTGRD